MTRPKAILYSRISTEEQAKHGYSLPEQIRELREYAEREGYEVVAEEQDPGFSRSTLNRPGMDRVRERVAAGGVDAVLAWRRDRFGAHPYPGMLEVEFAVSGCVLRALDDTGEGEDAEFMSGIKDLMSRQELRTMVRRTRAGKAGKVRAGKVLGTGPAPYGFRYVTNERGVRVGYEVEGAEMLVVRCLFELVGHRRLPMHAAGRKLEREGHYAPKGGPWQVSAIRNILLNDAYRPHTVEELRELGVSADVLATLETDASYGVAFFGKRRVIGTARGSRTYRRMPPREWAGVPVPDAGIPLEWVEGARDAIANNPRPAFGGGGRVHELSGGALLCGECGRAMTTSSSTAGGKKKYWYYGCPASRPRDRAARRCDNREMHRAERLEEEVVGFVDGELLTDPARLEAHMDAAIERELAALGSPAGTEAAWAERLAEVALRRERLLDLAERGLVTDVDLARRLPRLDEEQRTAEVGLTRSKEAGSRIAEMERAKRAVLEMFGSGLMGGVYWFPPRLRRQVYGLLGLRVEIFPDRTLRIEGEFDANLMRLTPEVKEYVAGLREIDERLQRTGHEDGVTTQVMVDRIERELAALRDGLCASAATSG